MMRCTVANPMPKLVGPMEALKYTEQLVDVLHLKSLTKISILSALPLTEPISISAGLRVPKNLTASETRLTITSLSKDRSP